MLDGEGETCDGACLHELDTADLTLGKPFLFPLASTATVAQALSALAYDQDVDFLSVWVDGTEGAEVVNKTTAQKKVGAKESCGRDKGRYHCEGIISTCDIIVFLSREENLADLDLALSTPLSILFPALSRDVEHVHPHTSLSQAYDLMLDGAQHLVVPTCNRLRRRMPSKIPLCSKDLPAGEYCWITQEDVVRHLLASLAAFYPLPMMSLKQLGMINEDVMMVDADSPAIQAAPFIERASRKMSAVAVVVACGLQEDMMTNVAPQSRKHRPTLVGDISAQTMRGCSATAAAAIATLSVREFLEFAHQGDSPSRHILRKLVRGLHHKGLNSMASCHSKDLLGPCHAQLAAAFSAVSPEQDETDCRSSGGDLLPEKVPDFSNLHSPLRRPIDTYSLLKTWSMLQHTQPTAMITCRPNSTLVAVMAQALAHRVNHVWVTDVDGGLVGIVTYADIINVLLSKLRCGD